MVLFCHLVLKKVRRNSTNRTIVSKIVTIAITASYTLKLIIVVTKLDTNHIISRITTILTSFHSFAMIPNKELIVRNAKREPIVKVKA